MKDIDIFLTIKVIYKEEFYEIKTEKEIEYEEFVTNVMEHFKIEKNKREYLVFKYYDEDNDINILEKNTNILDISQENMNGEYFVKLQLLISKDKNMKYNSIIKNISKNEDIFEEKADKNKKNIIENKDIKSESIEEIKKEYENKIILINQIYIYQIENIKNDIINLINSKYLLIQKEMSNLDLDIKNKKINHEEIEKLNINFSNPKDNSNNQIGIDNKSNFNINDIDISTIIKENRENLENNSIKKKNPDEKNNNDFVILDNEEGKTENINLTNFHNKEKIFNNEKEKKTKSFFFRKGKKKDSNEEKFKNALIVIHSKFKDYIKEIRDKGNEIGNALKANSGNINDMNKFYMEYIDQKNKENKILPKDNIEYYIVIEKINNFLQNKDIKQIIDEYLIYKEEFNENNFQPKINKNKEGYSQGILKYLNQKLL